MVPPRTRFTIRDHGQYASTDFLKQIVSNLTDIDSDDLESGSNLCATIHLLDVLVHAGIVTEETILNYSSTQGHPVPLQFAAPVAALAAKFAAN